LRRPLTLLATGLLLLGIEVATGVVSLGVVRLGTGARAVLSGDEFLVSAPRYVAGLILTLAGTALFVGLGWAERIRRGVVAAGEQCPTCGAGTRRVRRYAWHRLMARIFDLEVTRRRCERCGWSGLAN
jgi:hypothetical protein